MNRFYLFNTWVLIFFLVLTALFFVASCFYLFQLYNLDKKNKKRFKKQSGERADQRKRTYNKNLKLAAKLEANEILASAVSKQELKSKPSKKVKRNTENTKTRSSSCFDSLFKTKKKIQAQPCQYPSKEEDYFSEIQTYADQLDGQAQSYESFETMTTDSECYRDWRHSIDFMSNGVLSLNQYNNHNNEIMQRAYEQLYAQRHRTSTSSLCKPAKDDVSVPIVTDLYPVSVEPIVPYEYEPQPIHAYRLQVHNDEAAFRQIVHKKNADDLVQKEEPKRLDDVAEDQRYDGRLEEKLESSAEDRPTGRNLIKPNNLNDHNEKNKVTKKSVNETINKLSTLISVRSDGQIKQKILSDADSKSNLDRNMNLLKSDSTAVQM